MLAIVESSLHNAERRELSVNESSDHHVHHIYAHSYIYTHNKESYFKNFLPLNKLNVQYTVLPYGTSKIFPIYFISVIHI